MQPREMIDRLRAGDETALDDLIRYYRPLICYIITPILDNAHDREECISEVVRRVWDGIGSFDPGRGSWNAWLTALARNTALNKARGSRKYAVSDLSPDTPDTSPTPEQEILRREQQKALYQALKQLPQAEQALFYRKYYYLQPTAQIAAELGITERAAEGRLYRIKQKLRRMLGGETDDG